MGGLVEKEICTLAITNKISQEVPSHLGDVVLQEEEAEVCWSVGHADSVYLITVILGYS